MAAGYVPDKAFQTKMLHRTDKNVLRSQYPGEVSEQGATVTSTFNIYCNFINFMLKQAHIIN